MYSIRAWALYGNRSCILKIASIFKTHVQSFCKSKMIRNVCHRKFLLTIFPYHDKVPKQHSCVSKETLYSLGHQCNVLLISLHRMLCIYCYYPRRCKTSLVDQSAGLSVPRSPVRFRQKFQKLKTQNSHLST